MKIVITMAGSGSRFRALGFQLPKFMLMAKGRTLFSWSMESLRNFFCYELIFITLAEHQARGFIERECSNLGITKFLIQEISELTDGQASTVLAAQGLLRPSDAILIYNIDTFVEPTHLLPDAVRGDGWIPCFECRGDHFSFISMAEDGRVGSIAEKVRISPYGTIGLYYFSAFSLFRHCFEYCKFVGVKEKFVAPLYSVMIQENLAVYGELVPEEAVFVLGTPEEVAAFDPAFL